MKVGKTKWRLILDTNTALNKAENGNKQKKLKSCEQKRKKQKQK